MDRRKSTRSQVAGALALAVIASLTMLVVARGATEHQPGGTSGVNPVGLPRVQLAGGGTVNADTDILAVAMRTNSESLSSRFTLEVQVGTSTTLKAIVTPYLVNAAGTASAQTAATLVLNGGTALTAGQLYQLSFTLGGVQTVTKLNAAGVAVPVVPAQTSYETVQFQLGTQSALNRLFVTEWYGGSTMGSAGGGGGSSAIAATGWERVSGAIYPLVIGDQVGIGHAPDSQNIFDVQGTVANPYVIMKSYFTGDIEILGGNGVSAGDAGAGAVIKGGNGTVGGIGGSGYVQGGSCTDSIAGSSYMYAGSDAGNGVGGHCYAWCGSTNTGTAGNVYLWPGVANNYAGTPGKVIIGEAAGGSDWATITSVTFAPVTDNAFDLGFSASTLRPRHGYFATDVNVANGTVLSAASLAGPAGTDLAITAAASRNLKLSSGSSANVQMAPAGTVVASWLASTPGELQWATGGTFAATTPELLGPTDQTMFLTGGASSTVGRGVTITGAAGTSGNGGTVAITAGTSNNAGGTTGGAVTITTGAGRTTGGALTVLLGDAGSSGGVGGSGSFTAGAAAGTQNGGGWTFGTGSPAGSATTGGGFTVNCASGVATNQNGGGAVFKMGDKNGSGTAGAFDVQVQNNAFSALKVLGTGNIQLHNLVSTYNNVTTAGQGVASIFGAGRATAQTAANSSLATYTVGSSDGSFIVSGNVLVTTSTTHNFSLECAYTDEGNTARVATFNVQQLAGTMVTAITNVTGAGPYEGVPLHIRAKASTSITIRTNAGGTYTTVTYNAEGVIQQVQ